MNFNCKKPNHQNGCVCPPVGASNMRAGAISRGVWGEYVEFWDGNGNVDVSTVDLNDPNSEKLINRGYQQEDFLRVTRLSGWTPQGTTDEERAFVDTLRGVERRVAEVVLLAREDIIESQQSGARRPVTRAEAQDAWDEANQKVPPVSWEPGHDVEVDIDLMGEAS